MALTLSSIALPMLLSREWGWIFAGMAAIAWGWYFSTRKPKPYYLDEVRSALEEIGPSGKRALQHLMKHGNSVTMNLTPLPEGMSASEAIQAYQCCAQFALVKREDIDSSDLMTIAPKITFRLNPVMEPALNQLMKR